MRDRNPTFREIQQIHKLKGFLARLKTKKSLISKADCIYLFILDDFHLLARKWYQAFGHFFTVTPLFSLNIYVCILSPALSKN